MTVVDYGPDPAQTGELFRPSGPSRGVVVVIHGGFWRASYDSSLGEPLARRQVFGRDVEERLPVEVGSHLAPGRGAEHRPANIGLDQPREMEVQRGHLAVGTGVGEIDRVPDTIAAQ